MEDYLKQQLDQIDKKIAENKELLKDPDLANLAQMEIDELEKLLTPKQRKLLFELFFIYNGSPLEMSIAKKCTNDWISQQLCIIRKICLTYKKAKDI